MRRACLTLLWLLCAGAAGGQVLLDRIVATIAGRAVMLSDLRLAQGVGIVEAVSGPGADDDAVRRLIDRRLLAAELARLPPREPSPEAIDGEVQRMRERAGAGLEALLRATGYDAPAIRELARETLRIDAYLAQRFGAGASAGGPEARQLLNDLRARAQVRIIPADP